MDNCLHPAVARKDRERLGYFRAAESCGSRAPCSRHCVLTMHFLGSALRICSHCCPPHGIHEESSAFIGLGLLEDPPTVACATFYFPVRGLSAILLLFWLSYIAIRTRPARVIALAHVDRHCGLLHACRTFALPSCAHRFVVIDGENDDIKLSLYSTRDTCARIAFP